MGPTKSKGKADSSKKMVKKAPQPAPKKK